MTANDFSCNHTASGEGIVIKAIWGDVICEESAGNIIKNLQEKISVAKKQIEWRGVKDRNIRWISGGIEDVTRDR